MKKLLLLLIIPFLSFGQEISLTELADMKTANDFRIILLEKRFDSQPKNEQCEFGLLVRGARSADYVYGYNMDEGCDSDIKAYYFTQDEGDFFIFDFSTLFSDLASSIYFNLEAEIKAECSACGILESPLSDEERNNPNRLKSLLHVSKKELVLYSCPNFKEGNYIAVYNGKIRVFPYECK